MGNNADNEINDFMEFTDNFMNELRGYAELYSKVHPAGFNRFLMKFFNIGVLDEPDTLSNANKLERVDKSIRSSYKIYKSKLATLILAKLIDSKQYDTNLSPALAASKVTKRVSEIEYFVNKFNISK
ncbi:MAG: hypothetical protein WC755_01365 [Candidatus Woesearchaeota archaeon]|jgi:hypothetical protein